MSERKNEAAWLEKYSRWQIKVQSDGTRRTFTSSTPGKKGKVAAERAADKWLEAVTIGENTKVSVLLDQYYDRVKSISAYENCRQIGNYIERYMKPVIGAKRIGRLTENDLQRIIDRAYKSGKKPLAWKTLSNIRATISAFMKYCRKEKVTIMHPEDLKIPNGAKRPNKKIVDTDDIKTLFSSDMTSRYGKAVPDIHIHAYRFSVLTGIRPGERTGLQWRDISGSKLTVRRSINDAQNTTGGKNSNAIRTISISTLAQKELDAQKELLRQLGIVSKYVFPDTDGDFVIQKRFRQRWYKYCEYNKIKQVTPYEMRHTFVSVNCEMPEGLKKMVIGHSENMDTEGTYGHQKAGDMELAAQYIDDAFKQVISSAK